MFPFDNSPMRKRLLLEQNWLSTVIYMHLQIFHFISSFCLFSNAATRGGNSTESGWKIGERDQSVGENCASKIRAGASCTCNMIVINFPMLPFNINLAYLFARPGLAVSRPPPHTKYPSFHAPPLSCPSELSGIRTCSNYCGMSCQTPKGPLIINICSEI